MLKLEAPARSHDRDGFDCGSEPLNLFFKQTARQHEMLMMGAMQKFMEIFRTAGGIGLFVDAKDAKAKQFYEKFGFIAIPPNDLELFLPVKTIEEAVSESA